jgi:hypothetical protein
MKLIEVLNKLENYELPNKTKFKWRDNIVINKKGTLYCNDMFFSKILNFANAEALKEELEIIEEPKEIKLPEKLLMHYNDNVEEEIMLNRARINMILDYLKANQNKIIRELKGVK